MRLLDAKELIGNEELTLDEFGEHELPQYAILSHTWLKPNKYEVSFEDIQQGDRDEIMRKPGFKKIQNCCERALDDGIRWVWVDTCCINKASSSELSESINSMFRWYQMADVCYAYLSDVLELDIPAVPDEKNGTKKFQDSDWFNRAWTLQELLAPVNVDFYSGRWKYLGTRWELSKRIKKATNINRKYLGSSNDKDVNRNIPETNIKAASLATRMSWAAGREASKEEDIAYSLLGIFDVNMPLVYGEGKEKAFFRLQEEIMKDSDDHSLLVWAVPPERLQNQGRVHRSRESRRFAFATSPERFQNQELAHRGREWVRSRHFAFATSPEEFRGMNIVVPYASQEGDPPYAATNRGLEISLPVGKVRREKFRELRKVAIASTTVTASDRDPSTNQHLTVNSGGSRLRSRSATAERNESQFISTGQRHTRSASADEDRPEQVQVGLLRCHVEHDLNNVVAIPLKPLGGDSYERETDVPPGTVSQELINEFRIKKIYIKKADEGIDQHARYDRKHGFLIKSRPRPYNQVGVYPPKSWKEKEDMILRPPDEREQGQSWHVCLLFVKGDYGPVFIVTLGVVHVPTISTGPGQQKVSAIPWCKVQVKTKAGVISLKTVWGEYNKKELVLDKLKSRVKESLKDGNSVSVTLKPSKILGQEMCLVEMGISKEEACDTDEGYSDSDAYPVQWHFRPESPPLW